MTDSPENLVLHLLRGIDNKLDTLRAEVGSDIRSLRADMAADLLDAAKATTADQKQTREQIVGLRRAVVEYHSSAVGHGMLISELDERLRRIEERLHLTS